MIWTTNEVVGVLVFLLPGLVASAMFYSLTAHPKPNEFGQVVQALIFTILSQAAAWVVYLTIQAMWPEFIGPEGWEFVFPVLVAAVIALVAVYCSNHDTVHRLLRYAKATRETSYPSEWYSAFAENDDCYVVLYFHDGRRLYGWPQEWPGRPDQGHFVMAEGEWLPYDSDDPVPAGEILLISQRDIAMVEFVRIDEDQVSEE